MDGIEHGPDRCTEKRVTVIQSFFYRLYTYIISSIVTPFFVTVFLRTASRIDRISQAPSWKQDCSKIFLPGAGQYQIAGKRQGQASARHWLRFSGPGRTQGASTRSLPISCGPPPSGGCQRIRVRDRGDLLPDPSCCDDGCMMPLGLHCGRKEYPVQPFFMRSNTQRLIPGATLPQEFR